MAGLTLGGGYGPLIGRFGLALDNVVAADVVLADGRIVTAEHDREEELFWALRGGGGNFGVVTAMRIRLHNLPNVLLGMLVYPFSEAKSVLEGCIDVAASMPEDLTVQLGFVVGPDNAPVVLVVPTWCGPPGQGDAQVAPLLKLGTVLDNTVDAVRYGTSLATFDAYIVNGQRTLIETCWLPAFDSRASTSSPRRWRPVSHLVAPSSPMNSGVQPRAWRRRPRASAFVAAISSSRFLRRSSIGRTSSRSNDISDGCKPLLRPPMPWRFLVDIRICSPAAPWSAQRRALAAMPNGSLKPSGIMIPTTCSAPPSRSQSVAVMGAPAPRAAKLPPRRRAA
jgi:hypothetical protein